MAINGTPQPASNEFRVNTTILNAQTNAAIAGLTDGGFVVAWQSDSGDDTGRLGIFAQRYDASGNKVGAETLIFRLINQAHPSVAALTDGGFVVTFDASPPPAPTYLGYDIRFAHFNADGTRSNGVVTDYNGLGDFASSVVGLPDGGFVVSWQSEQVDGTFDILAQRYDANGIGVGSAVQVNTMVANGQLGPHVAALAGGGFVVAWQSEAQDGSGLGIVSQRFDANGAAVGTEFQINTYASNDQNNASVVGLSTGGFVVAWDSTGQDGSGGGIYGQIYDGSGNRLGGEFSINTYTSDGQGSPKVTAFADGNFVVVWRSAGQDGSGDGVYGQLFSTTGQKIGEEFLINAAVEGDQIDPIITVVGPNDFEVAWTSGGDIFARHFSLSTSNHAPVASDFSTSVNENAASVLLKGVYTDSDAADTFTFSTNTTGTIGTVINNNDGTFTYDPNGKFKSLGLGETATDTFKYTVTDNHGAKSTATATVTIQGENDATEVHLTDNSIAVEMLQLAAEAYSNRFSGLSNPHLGDDALAYQSGPHYIIASDAELRGWHPLSAIELDIAPADFGESSNLQFSFDHGVYQAFDSGDSLPWPSGDHAEADALVLTGMVNEVPTLGIAFRGTDQWADFKDYFDFKAHFDKFKPLIDKVLEYLAGNTNGIQQVLVSGHSLGSAMVDYFLSHIPPPYKNKVKAFTDGYPGTESPITDAPVNNFIHTDDLVANLGRLSSNDPVRKALTESLAVAASAAAAPAGPVAEIAAHEAIHLFLDSIKAKKHEGSDILLNSDMSNSLSSLFAASIAEHDSELYTKDVQKLYDFATDAESIFAPGRLPQQDIALYQLGVALGTDQLYSGTPLQIGVGKPQSSDESGFNGIRIDRNDDAALGDYFKYQQLINTRIYDEKLTKSDDRFIWTGGSKVQIIDGGHGTNTFVVKPPFIVSQEGFSWQIVGDHIELYGNLDQLLAGKVVHIAHNQIASLYRIQYLEFDLGGAPETIDLQADPNGNVIATGFGALALDGYIRHATVFADANNNSRLDAGEAFTISNGNGTLTPPSGSGSLVLFGGTDTSTGLPFTGKLRAPEGSSIISPLTTLVAAVFDQGVVNADQKVLTSLGLDKSLELFLLDPIAAASGGDFWGSTAFVGGAEVADTLAMIASALAGTDAIKYGLAWDHAVTGLASLIVGLAEGQALDLADADTVKGLIDIVLQIGGTTLDAFAENALAMAVSASNATLVGKLITDAPGPNFVLDVSAVQKVAQGAASDVLKDLAAHPDHAQNVIDGFTGTNLDHAVAIALSESTTPPVVSSVAADPSDGDLNSGHLIILILTLSKPVSVSSGTPTLSLNDGGLASYDAAATAALGDATKLVFGHTVSPGQNAADLAITGIDLNSATVQDFTNNDADLLGAITNPSGILIIDTMPPVLTQIADQTDEATGPNGAAASFSTSATDMVDGIDPVFFKEGNTVVQSGQTFSLGKHTITASAMDAAGNAASETFTINVVDTTAPTLSPVADQTVHATGLAGAVVTFAASATDVVDGTDPVVFKEGDTVVRSDQTFSLGKHTIRASATDAAGNTALESFVINVVDEAPIVFPLSASVGEDGPSFSKDLFTGASDPDPGTLLTVQALDGSVTTLAGRTLKLGIDYARSGTTMALTAAGFAKFNSLAATQTDQAVFHYGVADGVLVTPDTLTLTIIGADDAPALVNQTPNQSATAGTAYSYTLPANTFQDVDAGDHLTLATTKSDGTTLPSWLNFNAGIGTFSGTPGAGNVGGFDVKLTATDTGGLAASETFHFSVVAPPNHPPVISSDGGGDAASILITDNSRYVATVHAVDPDLNATIKYSIVGGADQKLFTIDPKTGVLSFKSMPKDGHSYHVTVAASDGSLQDTQTIKVKVADGVFESGNAGVADTFVFKPHFGLEIVSNFDATSPPHDILEFDHALFSNVRPDATPSAIFDAVKAHSFQLGSDVVIVTDTHDIIDLRNTDRHNLVVGDFVLV